MENGDIAALFELALYLEAAGGGDILKVDAAEASGDKGDGIDKFVDVLRFNAERKGVDSAEGLEENAFALHNGHTGLGTDVAEPENGGAVGYNGTEVVTAGQLVRAVYILLYLKARLSHSGRICKREILLRGDGHSCHDLDLSLPLLVEP